MVGRLVGYDYLLSASNKGVNYKTGNTEYIYLWEYLIGSVEILQILLLLLLYINENL